MWEQEKLEIGDVVPGFLILESGSVLAPLTPRKREWQPFGDEGESGNGGGARGAQPSYTQCSFKRRRCPPRL